MRIAYLDCFSGISGDMMLGVLLDSGVELAPIQEGIASLGLDQCRLVAQEVKRHGFRATKLDVEHSPEHAHRHLHHITEMIERGALTDRQKELACRIFTRLGEAEARVHGTTVRKVHFHEVGAVDSIADIVGTAIGFDLLGVDRLVCSPVPTGCGTVMIAHGRVSVPAPATAELLRGVPLAASQIEAELTTPTGAAIVTTLADEFGPLPAMQVERVGYGAGTRELAEQANVCRLFVGRADPAAAGGQGLETDQVWILETNLDDVSGEVIGHTLQLLLEAGALDAWSTGIQMKKNRPGVLVSVLCGAEHVQRLEEILFRETATLGIRRWQAGRHKLGREAVQVETAWGPVEGKLARWDNRQRFTPEYEACRRIALAQQLPLNDVYQAVQRAYSPGERGGGA